jgi:putative solute:sodium symporter small subunit
MTNESQLSDEPTPTRTDGGLSDVERERRTDYLDVEINLLNPATPFMRDHLRIIWTGFIIWSITTFGPITLTRIAPDLMTQPIPGIGFPLHYFLIAIVGPSAALILSVWYARKRDQLDEKYGIEQTVARQEQSEETATEEPTAADGGVAE